MTDPFLGMNLGWYAFIGVMYLGVIWLMLATI